MYVNQRAHKIVAQLAWLSDRVLKILHSTASNKLAHIMKPSESERGRVVHLIM